MITSNTQMIENTIPKINLYVNFTKPKELFLDLPSTEPIIFNRWSKCVKFNGTKGHHRCKNQVVNANLYEGQ